MLLIVISYAPHPPRLLSIHAHTFTSIRPPTYTPVRNTYLLPAHHHRLRFERKKRSSLKQASKNQVNAASSQVRLRVACKEVLGAPTSVFLADNQLSFDERFCRTIRYYQVLYLVFVMISPFLPFSPTGVQLQQRRTPSDNVVVVVFYTQPPRRLGGGGVASNKR